MLLNLIVSSLAAAEPLGPTMVPDASVPVATEDGWQLNLRHYVGGGPAVLLVHGMWVNHYNWDYRPEISLADYLRDEGFDVWVAELRGDPGSSPPSRKEASAFTFDDHVQYDLPALVNAVRDQTGGPIHWVGHSMGGMLLYAYLRDHHDDVVSGVAVSSPIAFPNASDRHQRAVGMTNVLVGKRVRAKRMTAVLRLWGESNFAYREIENEGNLSWPLMSEMSKHAVVDLPRAFVRDAGDWVRTGDVLDGDGGPWFGPSETPVLVLAGGGDKAVPIENVAPACDLYSNCTLLELSKRNGYQRDYGHVDILLGQTSRDEVYPLVTDFLQGG